MKLSWGQRSVEVRIGRDSASIGGRSVRFRPVRRGGRLEAIEIAGEVFPVRAAREGDSVFVWCRGRVARIERGLRRAGRAAETGGDLLSPMPGRVRRILVAPGQKAVRGEVILVLEAMKMEHAIRAPRAGVVTRIAFREGDLVEAGVRLAEIEEEP